MTLVNLSFAACGFMGIYHLGVAGALLRHGDRLLGSLRACAGASAGALVAAAVVTAPDKLEVCKDFTLRFADSVRRRRFGAVTPGYDFMLELREGVEEVLPADAHRLATGRLFVSVTHAQSGRNRTVSSFGSREELVKVTPTVRVRSPALSRRVFLDSSRFCWPAASSRSTPDSNPWSSKDRGGSMEDSPTASPSRPRDGPSPCLPLPAPRTSAPPTGASSTCSSDSPT